MGDKIIDVNVYETVLMKTRFISNYSLTSVKARVLLGEMKKQRLNAAAKTKKKSDDNAWISTKKVKPA